MTTAAMLSADLAAYRAAAGAMDDRLAAVEAVAVAVIDCLEAGGTVYTCGNGGSAADAQHLTAELIGHYSRDRRPLPAVTLTSDPSVWTCIANDFSADAVFARQVAALARPGDLLCAFTTSGRSPNVVAALRQAKARGVVTVLFGSGDGGPARAFADHALLAPAPDTPRIQELHTLMLHMICHVVDEWAGASADGAIKEETP